MRRRLAKLGWMVTLGVGAVAGVGGCALFGAAGVIAQEARRTQTITVEPLYTDLEGQSFAVVVEAPQTLQMTYPETVPRVTVAIAERLRDHSGATAYVPGEASLAVIQNNPGLLMRSYADVAAALDGVQRLVWIRMDEFRLHDAGNRFLWNGVASGSVMVIDAESELDDDIVFEKSIRVTYPDISGVSREDQNEAEVGFELLRRFINRASWPFYAHQERHPEFQPY